MSRGYHVVRRIFALFLVHHGRAHWLAAARRADAPLAWVELALTAAGVAIAIRADRLSAIRSRWH
jgi:hypothetical protein